MKWIIDNIYLVLSPEKGEQWRKEIALLEVENVYMEYNALSEFIIRPDDVFREAKVVVKVRDRELTFSYDPSILIEQDYGIPSSPAWTVHEK